jgi:hypothetical protein
MHKTLPLTGRSNRRPCITSPVASPPQTTDALVTGIKRRIKPFVQPESDSNTYIHYDHCSLSLRSSARWGIGESLAESGVLTDDWV